MAVSNASLITLLTDFGTVDGYVAAMKGVLATRSPDSTVIDITHEIPPGDVRAAAFILVNAIDTFPPGTVHVVVVDPGVGSDRAAIAVCRDDRWFVGPDNGVFSLVLTGDERGFVLDRPEHFYRPEISSTFHGRDVFAPIAAALATGCDGAQLGTPFRRPSVRLDWPVSQRSETGTLGSVVHVDRFGNLLTNIRVDDLSGAASQWVFRVGTATVSGLSKTYSDVETGEFLAVVGSTGAIEISVRDGSAEQRCGAGRDAAVAVEWS